MFASLRRLWSGSPRQNLVTLLGTTELPQLPAITMRVLETLRDPNADNATIAALVSQDPGLSVKVLRTVNSAAFGLRRPIDNVQHAVAVLGRAPLESMVLAVAVAASLPKQAPGLDHRRFWGAAARRAATAQRLCELYEPQARLVAFTAGLLQDMAIPLLAQSVGGDYGALLQDWHDNGGQLDGRERDTYGWDHAVVASWLCAEWRFPDSLSAAITGHHGGAQAPGAVRLVGMLPECDDGDHDELIETARDTFGARPDDVVGAIQWGEERGAEVAELFAG